MRVCQPRKGQQQQPISDRLRGVHPGLHGGCVCTFCLATDRTTETKLQATAAAKNTQTAGLFDHNLNVQVILDSSTPSITLMQLDVAPTVQSPIFKLLIIFSEPVSWLANSTAPTADPAAGAGSSAPATYSRSRLLLTNAALLNISMVPGTAAVLANGAATNAASGFVLWFRSWSGARAVVEVMGSAYQDFAGNRGTQDSMYEVRQAVSCLGGPGQETAVVVPSRPQSGVLDSACADHAASLPRCCSSKVGAAGVGVLFSALTKPVCVCVFAVVCVGRCPRNRPAAARLLSSVSSNSHRSHCVRAECCGSSHDNQWGWWCDQPVAQCGPHAVPGDVSKPDCALAAARVPAALCWA